MARDVFILGAGFSAPAGAPLINNFISSARHLFINDADDLKETGYYEYFKRVFLYRDALKRESSAFSQDFDDIEKIYSYSDFECSHIDPSLEKAEIKRSLVFLIIKTLDTLTRKTHSPTYLLDSRSPIFKKYHSRGLRVDLTMYEIFALVLSGKYHGAPCDSSVITFNYDVVLDNACSEHGINPYYCLPREKQKETSLKILKLHGSANWITCANPKCNKNEQLIDIKHGEKYLKEYITGSCPHCHQKKLMPLIVPPSWDKSKFREILCLIWKDASKEIQNARRVFIIGYSLPEVDLYFSYLLYSTLSFNTNNPEIYIINTEQGYKNVKDKLIKILTSGYCEKRLIERYSRMGVKRFIADQLRIYST